MHQFKIVLGCNVCQIRSRGRNQFIYNVLFYDFHLIYKAFTNILEFAIKVISYTNTR